MHALNSSGKLTVVEPPSFTRNHVDEDKFERWLIETNAKTAKILGRYLSTTGVIDLVLDHHPNQALSNNQDIGVLAHPLHAPRCIEQTRRAISTRQISNDIYGEGPNTKLAWDTATAQVWCRSLSNWRDYERIVQRLLTQGG